MFRRCKIRRFKQFSVIRRCVWSSNRWPKIRKQPRSISRIRTFSLKSWSSVMLELWECVKIDVHMSNPERCYYIVHLSYKWSFVIYKLHITGVLITNKISDMRSALFDFKLLIRTNNQWKSVWVWTIRLFVANLLCGLQIECWRN